MKINEQQIEIDDNDCAITDLNEESPPEYSVNQKMNKINNEAIRKGARSSCEQRERFGSFRPAVHCFQ